MADKIDKLQLLRTRYLERIRELDRTTAELKGKLLVLDELEAEYNSLGNGASESAPAAINGAAKTYAATGLTEAVFDVVELLGQGTGASASKIAMYLLGKGFQPKGKNFKISVGTTLKRLAKAKRIETKLEEGNRLYTVSKYK